MHIAVIAKNFSEEKMKIYSKKPCHVDGFDLSGCVNAVELAGGPGALQ